MGAGAFTKLSGSVLAVGPERIEVSARFVPGNSGSPILNNRGEVLAVASYLQQVGADSPIYEGTRFNRVRRFGLLVTPNVKWVTVSPKAYYRQTAILADVSTYYREIAKAISNLSYVSFVKTRDDKGKSKTYTTGKTRTFVRGDYNKTKALEGYNDEVWSDYLANFYKVYGENKRKAKSAASQQSIDRQNDMIVLKVKNMVTSGEKELEQRQWTSKFLRNWADGLEKYARTIKAYIDRMPP